MAHCSSRDTMPSGLPVPVARLILPGEGHHSPNADAGSKRGRGYSDRIRRRRTMQVLIDEEKSQSRPETSRKTKPPPSSPSRSTPSLKLRAPSVRQMVLRLYSFTCNLLRQMIVRVYSFTGTLEGSRPTCSICAFKHHRGLFLLLC